MKRLVGILAITLATTLPAPAAQPERDPQELAQVRQRLREVEDHLFLTPEQAEQVRPVIAGMLLSMKDVRDDYGVEDQSPRSRRRMVRELRAIRSHADERLKLFLSRAQIEELRSIRKEWRDEFRTEVTLAAR
ncbi:MAG TPA: hypothetical protein VFW15_15835 [Thermoanaerobaculia bacterium]|nr:hypothetical protein [Thermoanaerobaculia bacterium]